MNQDSKTVVPTTCWFDNADFPPCSYLLSNGQVSNYPIYGMEVGVFINNNLCVLLEGLSTAKVSLEQAQEIAKAQDMRLPNLYEMIMLELIVCQINDALSKVGKVGFKIPIKRDCWYEDSSLPIENSDPRRVVLIKVLNDFVAPKVDVLKNGDYLYVPQMGLLDNYNMRCKRDKISLLAADQQTGGNLLLNKDDELFLLSNGHMSYYGRYEAHYGGNVISTENGVYHFTNGALLELVGVDNALTELNDPHSGTTEWISNIGLLGENLTVTKACEDWCGEQRSTQEVEYQFRLQDGTWILQ